MDLNLTILLNILNTLKIDHWQTRSYAEHKALATAYEKLDELFDTFVEHYYGIYQFPSIPTKYQLSMSSYKDNLIPKYNEIKSETIVYLKNISKDSGDLKNICDEIEGEFNHLIYRLNQK